MFEKNVLEFRSGPIIKGPLHELNRMRGEIIEQAAVRTATQLDSEQDEFYISEANYLERMRLSRIKPWNPAQWFVAHRFERDRKFWSEIQSGLLRPSSESNRRDMVEKILRYY